MKSQLITQQPILKPLVLHGILSLKATSRITEDQGKDIYIQVPKTTKTVMVCQLNSSNLAKVQQHQQELCKKNKNKRLLINHPINNNVQDEYYN